MHSLARTLTLLLALVLLTGCVSFEQESDWRWKQFNPDYRPRSPGDYENGYS